MKCWWLVNVKPENIKVCQFDPSKASQLSDGLCHRHHCWILQDNTQSGSWIVQMFTVKIMSLFWALLFNHFVNFILCINIYFKISSKDVTVILVQCQLLCFINYPHLYVVHSSTPKSANLSDPLQICAKDHAHFIRLLSYGLCSPAPNINPQKNTTFVAAIYNPWTYP